MSKNTGGPAFPVLNDGHHMLVNMSEGQRLAEGMSLRDYFAAKALQGTMSNPVYLPSITKSATEHGVDKMRGIAEACYALADAMLAARGAP